MKSYRAGVGVGSRKIAVASPKGGAGKTTLTACLSLAMMEAGRCVDAFDLDPQGALGAWYQKLSLGGQIARLDEEWDRAGQLVIYSRLSKINWEGRGSCWRLYPDAGGFKSDLKPTAVQMGAMELQTLGICVPKDLVFGDFPPTEPEQMKDLLKGWDRVLIPCQPSPVDIQAVMALVAVLGRDPRLLLVWNGLDGSSYSRPEVLKTLGDEVGCPVAKATIPRRVGFRNAQLSGFRGLDEASKSAILSLALEVTS